MTEQEDKAARIAGVKRLTEAFGSDQARWPAGAAERVRPLLSSDHEARELMRETQALDQLLARASAPDASRTAALADRIVAAAIAKGPAARSPYGTGHIVQLPVRPSRALPPVRTRSVWQTAALLAACLVAGVFLGAGTTVRPLVQEFADSVGISDDFDGTTYAFYDDSVDEDGQ